MEEGRNIFKKQNRNNVFCSLRCRWQKQQRSQKQLVIIAVEGHRVVISCWQSDCCLLRKEKLLEQAYQEGCTEWWQELEEALKDVLIWARVPDMVDTLMLLHKEMVFGEELRLPQMEEGDLYQAIQWEAEQLVPWSKGSYNTAFAAHGTALEEEIVQLWAWPKEQASLAGKLLWRLRLHLQGIFVGLTEKRAQQAWYQGAHLQHWSLTSQGQEWEQKLTHVANSHYPQNICIGCVLLALVLHVCAWGGCYAARHHLDTTEQELARLELWQQRYEESQRLEVDLQKYQRWTQQLQGNSSHMGQSISNLGQQLSTGCWLEALRGGSAAAMKDLKKDVGNTAASLGGKLRKQGSSSPTWQVEGACYVQEDLERFLDRLEDSQQFTQVQLQHSQQGRGKLKFALTVKEK